MLRIDIGTKTEKIPTVVYCDESNFSMATNEFNKMRMADFKLVQRVHEKIVTEHIWIVRTDGGALLCIPKKEITSIKVKKEDPREDTYLTFHNLSAPKK